MSNRDLHPYNPGLPWTFILAYSQKYSDPSVATIEPDGHLIPFHNYRHLTLSLSVCQHGAQFFRIGMYINVFNLLSLLGISFTSRNRIGSGVFSKNQYFFRHLFSLHFVFCGLRKYFLTISVDCNFIAEKVPNNYFQSCQCFQIDI